MGKIERKNGPEIGAKSRRTRVKCWCWRILTGIKLFEKTNKKGMLEFEGVSKWEIKQL